MSLSYFKTEFESIPDFLHYSGMEFDFNGKISVCKDIGITALKYFPVVPVL